MSSWWSNDRISTTVTESYIVKRLGARKQSALRKPLAFGAGLTDDTYLDWILIRSPRLFLVLDDIGCVDHIFESVDKSFDDNDLPLNEEAISELGLISGNKGWKFAKRQYAYLVQDLESGAHVDYGDDDVIPVTQLPRKQGGHQLSANVDRVRVGEKTFLRRRLSLDEESGIESIHFILHFKSLQRLKHPHLTSVWATYTHQEDGYVLLQPSSEMTLKAFLEEPPKHFKTLTKPEQREIIVRWIQCMTNALSYLHENGYAHQAIRPSNIFLDSQYNIYLGAYGALGALEDKEPAYEKDAYNHGAPEQWQRRATLAETNPLRSTLQSGGRTGRRIKQRSGSNSQSSSSTATPQRSPEETPRTMSRASDNAGLSGMSTTAGTRTSTMSAGSTAATAYTSSTDSQDENKQSRRTHAVVSTLTYAQPNPSRTLFDATPFFPSDVFSMCTIITSLLSLLASISRSGSKLAPSNLIVHLGKRNRTNGRGGKGGAPADVSWHSNLGQVSSWLDLLDQSVEKPTRKLTLGRKDAGEKEGDSESWRWKGLLSTLTDLVRLGFQKDINVRWTAPQGAAKVNEALKKWGIGQASCCDSIKSANSAQSSAKSTASTRTASSPQHRRSSKRVSTQKVPVSPVSTRRSSNARPQRPTLPEKKPSIYSDTPDIPELPAEDMYSPRKTDFVLSPTVSELPAREADMSSPYREHFVPPQQEHFISPQQEHFISPQQESFVSPQHEQFVSPRREQFISPRQDRFASPHREHFVSPQRENFVSPSRQTWDFGFANQQEEEHDDIGSYYDEDITDDAESILNVGLDNFPSPVAYQHRDLPPLPLREKPQSVMERPRPPTSGMVPWPIRDTGRLGAVS